MIPFGTRQKKQSNYWTQDTQIYGVHFLSKNVICHFVECKICIVIPDLDFYGSKKALQILLSSLIIENFESEGVSTYY